MVLNSGPVDKILEFDESLRKLDNDHTEPESSVISAEAYDEALTVVLRDLQETVSRNDVELAQVCPKLSARSDLIVSYRDTVNLL